MAPTETPTPAPKKDKPSIWKRIGCCLGMSVLILIVFVGAAAGGGYVYFQKWMASPYPAVAEPEQVELTIAPGSSLTSIAAQLENQGLIDRRELFMAMAYVRKQESSIQAGEYVLETPLSPESLISRLKNGRFERKLTIPEGWTTDRIADRLVSDGWIDSPSDFMSLTTQPLQLAMMDGPVDGAEGYCFPETYLLAKDSDASDIFARLTKSFEEHWVGLDPGTRSSQSESLTPHEIVILASIVEREARRDDEMPMIASVMLNRLDKGMKLQVDATVRYALGGVWDRKLLYKDLEFDSPYNTYAYKGLPPGPISNPGAPAIAAVLRPAESDFFYYVHRGDGSHEFTKTFKEHNAAIRKFLR